MDARQAKRLFPIFGAGGRWIRRRRARDPAARRGVGAENLLFVWAAGLAVGFVLCRLALGAAPGAPRRHTARRHASALHDIARGLDFVRRSRLLAWMAAAAVLFSVLFYSLFLPFAQAASERFPNPEELAGFFGLLWAAIAGAAFLVSVLITNRLFAWLGVAAMIVVLSAVVCRVVRDLVVRVGSRDRGALARRNGRVAVGRRVAGVGDADQRRPGGAARPNARVHERRAVPVRNGVGGGRGTRRARGPDVSTVRRHRAAHCGGDDRGRPGHPAFVLGRARRRIARGPTAGVRRTLGAAHPDRDLG